MGNMSAMLSMEGCKPTDALMVLKECAENGDEELLERSESETYRSLVGILTCFKRDIVLICIPWQRPSGEFVTSHGAHEATEMSQTLHPGNARRALGTRFDPGGG